MWTTLLTLLSCMTLAMATCPASNTDVCDWMLKVTDALDYFFHDSDSYSLTTACASQVWTNKDQCLNEDSCHTEANTKLGTNYTGVIKYNIKRTIKVMEYLCTATGKQRNSALMGNCNTADKKNQTHAIELDCLRAHCVNFTCDICESNVVNSLKSCADNKAKDNCGINLKYVLREYFDAYCA